MRLGLVILLAGCRFGFDDQPVEMPPMPCEPSVDVTAIASGADFSCVLLAGGEVRCWGAGESGQLGDGARATRLDPVAPSGLGAATAIAAGLHHACAVVAGDVWCWGRNDAGQVGSGDRIARDAPMRVSGMPSTVAGVTAGGMNSCAWTTDGALYCWGQENGHVSGGSTTPLRVTGVPPIAQAVAGTSAHLYSANHACALGTDGTAWCWGSNAVGELGIDDLATSSSNTPLRVVTSLAFVELAAGYHHTCGRTDDGTVACWGLNADGEVGDGTTTDRAAPVVLALGDVVELDARFETTCARTSDGAVHCWGDNDHDQLGRTGDDALAPERIDVAPMRAIAIGRSHTCGVTTDGVVWCWGSDRAGQRSGALSTTAAEVANVTGVDAISAGGSTTCARSGDRVQCWGHNGYGQIGDGTREHRAAPVEIDLGGAATSLAVGSKFACAAIAGGNVMCWGDNERDEVRYTDDARYLSPVSVTGLGIAATSVAAGGSHACALGASGVPWCWGHADEGILGRGGIAEETAPPGASNFANAKHVSAGRNHTCIVSATNALWCAGRDNEGQIGRDDNAGDVYTPLEVTAAPMVVSVGTGNVHTCAASTGGTAWCWGGNAFRQIGDGSDRLSEIPVAIDVTNIVEVASTADHSCARSAAGNVWCWGSNASGQLGDGTFVARGTPTAATELSGAVQLALGDSHTCVLRGDGTVRCVGAGDVGQLGDGRAVVSPAPLEARVTCTR